MSKKYYFLALCIFLLDHATKWAAHTMLDPERPVEVVPGYLRLSYAQNTGVAFGMFSSVDSPWKPYILAALAVAAVVVILVFGARTPSHRVLFHWSLAIILGGILGNLVDRVLRGAVIDFIDFHVHEAFYWPTFNIADSAISVGVALLLIDTVRNSADREAPEAEPS